MKTFVAFLAALVLVAAIERPAQAAASTTVTVDYFYDALAPYGDWVEVEGYGYCFRPTISLTDPTWRPYTEGSWIYTDAGWTWDSAEDFGWATYHYGRWLMVGETWFWVPGDVWGPAWVSWRADDEYVGWAPLPPEADWTPNIGISIHVDVNYDIGPAYYCFVPVRYLGHSHLRRYVEPWQRNVYFMRRTDNYTRITHRSTGSRITAIFNEGPDYTRFARSTEQPIRRMNLAVHEGADFSGPRKHFRNWAENDRFRVIAPDIDRKGGKKSAPTQVKQQIDRAKVNRGWQGYRQEEVRELRTEMQTASRDTSGKGRRPAPAEPRAADQPPTAQPPREDPTAAKGDAGKTRPPGRSQDPDSAPGKVGPSKPGRGDDPNTAIRPDRDEEIRKAEPTVPGQDDKERNRVRPGDVQPPKVAPLNPDRTSQPDVPNKFRVSPQDAPPRSTVDPRAGVNRPDDNPPGPARKVVPGEDRGNSKRPEANQLPKMKTDRDKKDDRTPRVVPPQQIQPPSEPKTPKVEKVEPRKVEPRNIAPPKEQAPKVEPRKVEPRKEPAPKVEPRNEPPRAAPPQKLERPGGGNKGNTGDDDKKKKPQ